MKMASTTQGEGDGVLDQGSDGGSDEKLSLSGYIFKTEPRFMRDYSNIRCESEESQMTRGFDLCNLKTGIAIKGEGGG